MYNVKYLILSVSHYFTIYIERTDLYYFTIQANMFKLSYQKRSHQRSQTPLTGRKGKKEA